MNTLMPRENLAEIFDEVTCEITRQVVGIQLCPGGKEPEGEVYTVYITFDKGVHSCLSLCAEKAMLVRLTKNSILTEEVAPQDVEDVTKEYFNVLCGRIVSRLLQKTKTPVRFSVPAFQKGHYTPGDRQRHIVLTYTSDKNEHAQLIHYAPAGDTQNSCI